MKLSLSYAAVKLLKYTLSYTGEKEVNEKGQEVNSPRRINGEDSSQRRHFTKAVEPLEKEVEDQIEKNQKAHNELVSARRKSLEEQNKKEEGETDSKYKLRIDVLLNKEQDLIEAVKSINEKTNQLLDKKLDFEVNDKVYAVMVKYFKAFGDTNGFTDGDDSMVAELIEILK